MLDVIITMIGCIAIAILGVIIGMAVLFIIYFTKFMINEIRKMFKEFE